MLTTKNADRSKLPPMKLQYAEIKDKYPNDIVMFRVGDFFEAYFEDALPVSTICGLRFTGQRIGNKNDKEEKYIYIDTIDEDIITVMNGKIFFRFFDGNKQNALVKFNEGTILHIEKDEGLIIIELVDGEFICR